MLTNGARHYIIYPELINNSTDPADSGLTKKVNFMFVSIRNVNNTIQVKTQFNPDFVCAAKQIGGKFDYDQKAWCFDERNLELVKNTLMSLFGTDGYNQSIVDVEVTVKKRIVAEKSPIYLAGRIIAQAGGRDSGATCSEKIAFIEKKPQSGGSMKYWTTEIAEGAVFRILDLYEGATDLLDQCDSIEYKIINKHSNHSELEYLKSELARITARIAELTA